MNNLTKWRMPFLRYGIARGAVAHKADYGGWVGYLFIFSINPPFFFMLGDVAQPLVLYYYGAVILCWVGVLSIRYLACPVLLSYSRSELFILQAVSFSMVFSTIIGLFCGNQPTYMFVDLAQISLVLGMFYLLRGINCDVGTIIRAIALSGVAKFIFTIILFFTFGLDWLISKNAIFNTFRYIDLLLPLSFAASAYLFFVEGRRLYLLVSIILIFASVASMTRGIWLAEILVIIYLMLRKRSIVPLLSMIIIGALILPLGKIVGFDVLERALYTKDQLFVGNEAGAKSRRIDEFQWILSDMGKNPLSFLIGAGPGSFYSGETGYGDDVSIGDRHYVHNQYLSIFFRFGFLGLIVLLALPVIVWKRLSNTSIGLIYGSLLISVLSLSFTSPVLYTFPYSLVFFAVSGVFMRQVKKNRVMDYAFSNRRKL